MGLPLLPLANRLELIAWLLTAEHMLELPEKMAYNEFVQVARLPGRWTQRC